jgi:hypothetical protein
MSPLSRKTPRLSRPEADVAALAADKNYLRRLPGDRNFPVAAGVKIYMGAMVSVDATGLLRPSRETVADKVVGVAKQRADNTGGAASAISCEIESDFVVAMYNSGGGDAIAVANVGADCFAVDDQTVALTNNGGARPRAGKIHNVTEAGVWVRFDQ